MHWMLFEGNNGVLELVTVPKIRPRMKHVATKYHHFREPAVIGKFEIKSIDTTMQQVEVFTKSMPLA